MAGVFSSKSDQLGHIASLHSVHNVAISQIITYLDYLVGTSLTPRLLLTLTTLPLLRVAADREI